MLVAELVAVLVAVQVLVQGQRAPLARRPSQCLTSRARCTREVDRVAGQEPTQWCLLWDLGRTWYTYKAQR